MNPSDTGIPDITWIDLTSYVGLLAVGLLSLNVLMGLLLSTRYNPVARWPHRRIPLYDLHNWTGYAALGIVVVHPILLLFSATAKFGLLDILVPFWAPQQPLWNTIGAAAAYALMFVVTTSYFRVRIGIRFWKKLHFVAYAVTAAFFLHSIMTNPNLDDQPVDFTDGGKVFVEICTVLVAAAVAWRVAHGMRRARLRTPGSLATRAAPEADVPASDGFMSQPTTWSGQLRVARVFQETPTVKTFRLASPNQDRIPFTFKPGQFLTLVLPIGDREVRRTYTISSAPTQTGYVEITVKREPQGTVSQYFHDQVSRGDLLEIRALAGSFTFAGDEANGIVLIAGGVGITPMMSVLRHLTDWAWEHGIWLVFAVATPRDVIYEAELLSLQQRHSNFHLQVIVTNPAGTGWSGETGLVTRERLRSFVPDIAQRRVHLCGPSGMMTAVRAMLSELGVPENAILTEYFSTPADLLTAAGLDGQSETTVRFLRSAKTVRLMPPQTLLDAAEAGGIALDYSCRTGTCGTCRVQLSSGTVAMGRTDALLEADIAERLVLACQARPTSSEVEVNA